MDYQGNHFRERMWEWIHENFETVPNVKIPKTDKWFIRKIQKRENAHQYSRSDSIKRRSIWTIKFLGKWCFIVYDEAQRRVTTVLPNKWLTDHLAKRAREEAIEKVKQDKLKEDKKLEEISSKIKALELEISEEIRIEARQQRFIEEIRAKQATRRMAKRLASKFQNIY